jgi:hypothetical protein
MNGLEKTTLFLVIIVVLFLAVELIVRILADNRYS